MKTTVWVLGDQLNRSIGAMAGADPDTSRVLMVESEWKITSKPFHRQRLHLVLTAMRRFADELRAAGFEVDYRKAPNLAAGLRAHRDEFGPAEVRATEPLSRSSRALLEANDVGLVRSNQFLCHYEDFAAWADGRRRLRMEDFYRWQRRRTGYLMDGDEPAGGRWNFDADNREPPPEDAERWPDPVRSRLDAVDDDVIASLPESAVGADPVGLWATSRRAALARLRHFVDNVLPDFGPHEDAMTTGSWHLAHSLLSPYLNIGLLLPDEVCDAVEDAYRSGGVPINSAEGFIRQVIGWREYMWGLYWLWPDHASQNVLDNDAELPPVFTGSASTDMRCLSTTLANLHERGWIHHIERLMILSNLSNLIGIHPQLVSDWMWSQYVDGAEWVMIPNVFGMGMWADGGRTATKPYVSGGAYVNRMSDYCAECRFDPKRRTGDSACPFTTLYWDFLDRHRTLLEENHRMGRILGNLDRLKDMNEVRTRAGEVRTRLAEGSL